MPKLACNAITQRVFAQRSPLSAHSPFKVPLAVQKAASEHGLDFSLSEPFECPALNPQRFTCAFDV